MTLKNLFFKIVYLCLIFFVIACESKKEIERPRDPWVFRSVLDKQARMVTVALHEDLYVAYDAKHAGLYKVWKGGVNFDGAVYTSVHGPQPTSRGYAFYSQPLDNPYWRIIKNNQEIMPEVHFKGYSIEDNQVTFNFHLIVDGNTIIVREKPEYISKDAKIGFSRTFITENVPQGYEVALLTTLTSLEKDEDYNTNGKFSIRDSKTKQYELGQTISIGGILVLHSNDETTLNTFFHVGFDNEGENSQAEGQEVNALVKGATLIENSDCKSCHNEEKKTIGPAYIAVAEKYDFNDGNIAKLAEKVIKGGSGNWGEVMMNAHPDLQEDDARAMISYILSLSGKEKEVDGQQDLAAGTPTIPLVLTDDNKNFSEEKDPKLYPGLATNLYTYSDRSISFFEIGKKFPPTLSGVSPAIHVLNEQSLGAIQNNVYLEFKGFIDIPEDNNYVFRLISDDGSWLFLDGEEIINNEGDHAPIVKDGEMYLKKGMHELQISYQQGGGGGMVSFQWATHGTGEFSVVPNNVLKHKKEQFKKVVPYITAEQLVKNIPGDMKPLLDVHPSFDLSQARPDDFQPRVGGMDFLPDGRMILCTWDSTGPVYLIDGVSSGKPADMKVKRIAAGLAEPLGIKVVDGEIFVLQKQELTQLIDHDGDDIIDEYRTISDRWSVSPNFHEFAFGLEYKDGFFYAALATAIEPGGASSNPQIPDRGKALKISRKDGSIEFVAHGLRTPNGIGIGIDNEIFIADNQGDWLPASKIVHLQPNAFYGSRSVNFEGTASLKETLPVVWLPQNEIGNSPSQPTYLNVGPYQGQMIHGEVTHGGIKRVFVEKVNGNYQGVVFRFTQGLEAGVNRLEWGPDGALYIGGVGSTGNWLHQGKLWYGLQRLTYNEKPTFEMLAVRAKSNGMEIELTAPIAKEEYISQENFEVNQWYYKPTAEYGGPKMDLKALAIKSVNLSEDRKRVFLELEGMKPAHVVYVHIKRPFKSSNNLSLWSTEAWYTLNAIPANDPGFSRPTKALADNTLSDEEKAAGWQLLFDGNTTKGWRTFKKQTIGSAWKVANGTLYLDPSKKKDWQTIDGGDIITDQEYENFELTFDWKVIKGGNSGLIFNIVEDEKYEHVWHTGPEMQILDNLNHPDGQIETHRAGDLYDMIATKYVTVNAGGKWNQARLVSNKGKVEHWLNGHKLVEYQMHGQTWKDMIKNSKFKDMPDFGSAKKGHLALQDHGDKVWFKNMKIKKL